METYELFVLRHGKSDWENDAPSDFQRPLNKRGIKAANHMAKWMAENIEMPLQIASSPALRAWQTAVAVSQAVEIPEHEILFLGELYLASCEELLTVLSVFSEDEKRVLLIGHNPGLELLVSYLADKPIPESDDGKIMPTATLAHLTFSHNWQQLSKGTGTLQWIRRPK